MTQIRITWSAGEVVAELRDTPTARQLLENLPLTSSANVWGDEVYFSLPFSAAAEPDASEVVDRGAVCFWLGGDALALLFGPTPISREGECRLISPANIVGQMKGDFSSLKTVENGENISVAAV